MIKIPLLMKWIDPAGAEGEKTLTVMMSDPIVSDKSVWHKSHTYQCQFTLRIPDHIWDYLAGKIIPAREYGWNKQPIQKKKSVKEFPKTLSANTLRDICREWEGLLDQYRWRRDIDKHGIQKVIFYRFETASGQYQDQWSNKKRSGQISQIRFSFVIGHRTQAGCGVSDIREGRDLRYDDQYEVMDRHSEKDLYEMKWVKWTQVREQFFIQLQADFESVIGRIDAFEASITEKNLNRLIASQQKLLGTGGSEP